MNGHHRMACAGALSSDASKLWVAVYVKPEPLRGSVITQSLERAAPIGCRFLLPGLGKAAVKNEEESSTCAYR